MSTQITVLLIEDDLSLCELIETFFEESNMELHCAASLQEGLDILRERKIDVVLCDLGLPDSEGLDGPARIQEVWEGPIVILTGRDDQELAIEALQHNIQDYLVKGAPGWKDSILRSVRYAFERFRLQSTLRAERAALEVRIADRTRALHRVNEELVRLSRLKDEFIARISHELRTPVATILGLAESLNMEIYGSLSKRQRMVVKDIEESGKYLLALLNDLLDLAKLRSGELELGIKPVSLHELCSESINIVRPQAKKKGIKLRLILETPDLQVTTDPKRLKQILINLLSNGIKYTDTEGEVGLTIRRNTETAEITVWDTGIGMDTEQVCKLFDESSFGALLSLDKGLGLAVVRQLSIALGIKISFHSEIGKGTKITLKIPIDYNVNLKSLQTGDPESEALYTDAHRYDGLPW